MSLAMTQVLTLLKEHHLLKTVTGTAPNEAFAAVTYDSRQVKPNTLFFCKGNFKPSYLTSAKKAGATAYVSETAYPEGTGLTAIIVSDVQKAMALLGAAFYDYPQNELFIVAFTGTKGKTTSAYFTHAILQHATNDKTALFSTIDRVLGPRPGDRFKSHLTTPESLDLFRDMRTAVTNGMTHLVMEVSSQAYKKNRVYGLTFDVGIFLNISPDHVGPNEHPTFADYLHCKEQLLVNSRKCIINAETDHFQDVYYAAKTSTQPENVYLYGRQGSVKDTVVDVTFNNQEETLHESDFVVTGASEKGTALGMAGAYTLHLPGDYNESNAVSAAMAATLAGAKPAEIKQALVDVHVPGRMEMIDTPNHGTIYIDYAHNYASMKALLSFLRQQTDAGRVIVVVGSTGDKGVSRRKGFGQALSEEANVAILTTDDPGFEDPRKIAQEIDAHIDHDRVSVQYVMDRSQAIRTAIEMSRADDIVVLAGKGEDAYQKINGVDTPYATDVTVAKNVVKELS
ncbi:UDP-N-acetylmuramoyl-L-alanyl-D-glutamate--2,6-diaminopimelate ligase [Secundilactobacillus kimchicus]|uniref:UDP-N-acetylmuramoyl-L-alanyl-D-glutamate--2, 6-diaminopimelate ligase n=1 Tax=Secundilactobacillus kimchicus TaxID=528209 RepID=UPI001C032795|nr:UDP-N-acetylmuramoyl-L-alanyl-D-glutamate--2,6-diaminopimelate ligase [Secundilactobacillus kimchicus]MBT9671379.1 UDP-N-acetylmuramoyl-L-alanyl-D-glutamate--2,6-diaminopimelate ligase [Secundilactobacillus kimchicus]